MAARPTSLENIHIASPCTAAWSEMLGDDQVRYCMRCEKHVYNLSSMSRAEAEALVEKTEGRMCVRFYVRGDGMVLTDDCPVGLRLARQALRRSLLSLAAGIGFVLALMGVMGGHALRGGDGKGKRSLLAALRQIEPIGRVIEFLDPSPPPPPPPGAGCVMGSLDDY